MFVIDADFPLVGFDPESAEELTGTNAKYYAQSSDCGATLDAGASCTIGVTFTPTVTGIKSAKLSITTSATSTPLSVSLSGTGVLPP